MSPKRKKDRSPFKDPHAAREAKRYEHPVPSREAVMTCLGSAAGPLSIDELHKALGVKRERDEDAFARRLRAMVRDGQIFRDRRGRFGLAQRAELISGRVSGHPDGFGFLIPDRGGGDIFISPRDMRQLLHGDRATVRLTGKDNRGRRLGSVVEVLERRHHCLVGRLAVEKGVAVVDPSDRRVHQEILVSPKDLGGARDGQIVVAELLRQPTRNRPPMGRIVEVLGEHLAPGMEIEIALRKHELPNLWPRAVQQQARHIPAQVDETDLAGREDLRPRPLVTIDGADARDFDDAVYAERRGPGWRLIVAIADVSHYVAPDTPIDTEGRQRGNSVYFPGQVIPMLPEVLSNGLCSINPGVDRLCMSCDMHIDAQGRVTQSRFYPAVMRSHARLTYSEVAAILVEGDRSVQEKYAALLDPLRELYALFRVLRAAREKRGAIDLELPETRIMFDDQRKISRIVPVERNDAHKLIEECMLAANVCAAELLQHHQVPALYRNHERPPPDKVADLRNFLRELGLSLGGGEQPSTRDYSALMVTLAGRADRDVVQIAILRSLSQAIYSPDDGGHFALGYEHYAHFTSPIRRYPDLIVHRLIKRIVARKKLRRDDDAQRNAMRAGEHCSMTERRADEATRDVVNWLKAEYMLDRVGEEFDGAISGVTGFGVFVRLDDVFVEGLVHITALSNDYYHFDAGKLRLNGERTGTTYRLGDKMRIRVVRVDLDEAQIDFEPAAAAPRRRRRR